MVDECLVGNRPTLGPHPGPKNPPDCTFHDVLAGSLAISCQGFKKIGATSGPSKQKASCFVKSIEQVDSFV